jgi:uncharacterized protein (DUF2141 family)
MPTEFLRSARNVVTLKIQGTQARCDFENIPPGTYAIVVIHDENMNGKLDTNWTEQPSLVPSVPYVSKILGR